MYTLQITVDNGHGLPSGDLNGYSDPYVKIHWGGRTAKTSVKKKTLNPYWNETFSLSSNNWQEPVTIVCMDKDTFTRDDELGSGSVNTLNLQNNLEKQSTVRLSRGGTINLRLKAINFPGGSYRQGGEMTVDQMINSRYGAPPPQSSSSSYTTVTTYTVNGGGRYPVPEGPRYDPGMNYVPPPQTNSYYPPPPMGSSQGSYYPPPPMGSSGASYYPPPPMGSSQGSYYPPPPMGSSGAPPYNNPPPYGYGGPPQTGMAPPSSYLPGFRP